MRQEPAKTRWREGGYGLLVYESEEQVRALDPDFRMLRDMGNILIIATAPGDKTDIVSRVFAPGAGIDEDPVTGSAHCLLTPYWAQQLGRRSDEHTSELQYLMRISYAVFCLKKKKKDTET